MILLAILMGVSLTGFFLATYVHRRNLKMWPVDVGVTMMVMGLVSICAVIIFALMDNVVHFVYGQVSQLASLL